ncbi:hypothetical protein A4H97_24290 [Niastella yeongjuensis]|uniref:Fibronectin type-III domain-containing protein n=1 Tax=Niastella yeongjuensis TaxID=354355 RepID=A0A1V9F3G9_9BACT|nr:hypothetical protein [Niastella yeongjuensis]OQP52822.1 hypothetical protein A4H97_24290 [Niastella yeongjuensis]SEP20542.1 hypothetical protein SAMN05660816_04746 [Niastella yeongjuensis]
MKQKLLLILVLLTGGHLQAQVVINLQLPPLGLTIKPHLWNMSLVNTTGGSMDVELQMVMTDVGTGHTVLTATTPSFILPAGVKAVTASTVSPVIYTAGAGYTIDANPNGFLPVGVYNICYTLTRWTNDISDQLADECITTEIEPISPPQLIQPADSDQVITRRPFFTWLPPTPYNSFSNLLYDWVLVEVQPTQSAADAIQQNVPVYLQSNLSFTSLQYPLSMQELDTGKNYAWRVTAKNNVSPIANSEVWSFKIQQFITDTFHAAYKGYYAQMRREQDASYVISGDNLRFLYLHEINTPTVQVKITDISMPAHQDVELDSTTQGVKYGLNYLNLDLGNNGLVNRHMYLLTIINERNENWFLKFEYRKSPGE